MIAHFALMGSLYQHNPYDTEASLWNTYPWQIGAENELTINSSLPDFSMSKTIWDVDGDHIDGPMPLVVGAELGTFSMFAALIIMDSLGNIGSDIGDQPSVLSDVIALHGGTINYMTTFKKLIIRSVNDTTSIMALHGGTINYMTTFKKLIIQSVNDTTSIMALHGGTINYMTSETL